MYVGHALLGFALAATLARWRGFAPERALALGALAGGFGFVPDVDLAYTALAVARAAIEQGSLDVFPTTQFVWTKSWVVHRELTHSLIVGTVTAAMAAACAQLVVRRRGGPAASANALPAAGVTVTGGSVLALGITADGLLGAATAGLYVGAALSLAWLAAGRGLSPVAVGAGATVGLLAHPFGDLWMGRPPAFLYPFWTTHLETIIFAADPALNFLALFGVEIALAWWAVVVVLWLSGRDLLAHLRPRAAVGVGYAGAILAVPPPSLALAYQFSAGVLALGVVVGFGPGLAGRTTRTDATATALVTGLAATTLGLIAYLVAYLAVGSV